MKRQLLLVAVVLVMMGLLALAGRVLADSSAAAPGSRARLGSTAGLNSPLSASAVYTVDGTSAGGLYLSLAIVDGHPAVAYLSQNSAHLKFARAGDVAGSQWGLSLTVDTGFTAGQFASLAVVDNDPAIAYYSGASKTLSFARASDVDGTSWPVTHTVDSTGNVGLFASLAVVDGHPAIAYYDGTTVGHGHLKYVRAANADGTSWGMPITVDSAGDTGWYSSLAVVNGQPAIVYFDINGGGHLRYVRATNMDGTAWGITHTVDSQVNPTQSARILTIVNDNPAIAYGDANGGLNGHLKYVRASDANGDTWGAPVTVDVTGNAGYYPSLAVIQGLPAIAYCDNSTHALKLAQALDAAGAAWRNPTTLDSGQFDEFSSLAEVNGQAGIAYEDQSGLGSLRLAVAALAAPIRLFVPLAMR